MPCARTVAKLKLHIEEFMAIDPNSLELLMQQKCLKICMETCVKIFQFISVKYDLQMCTEICKWEFAL